MNAPALPEDATPPEPQTPEVVESEDEIARHAMSDLAYIHGLAGHLSLGGESSPKNVSDLIAMVRWNAEQVIATRSEQPDFAHTHPEVYDMANGGGDTPIAEQPAFVGGVDREALFGALHALERLRDLTPGRANARDLADYHGSICAIAETALANFTPALTARPSAPAEVGRELPADVREFVEQAVLLATNHGGWFDAWI